MSATLRMIRCTGCGRLDTPTRVLCAQCLSREFVATDVPGTGTLASWTTIRRASAQFRSEAPFDVAVVDLDAGPRVTGRLHPQSPTPAVGARVKAVSANRADAVFTVDQA